MNIKSLFISGIVMLILDGIYLSTFGNFFNSLVVSIQGSKIQFNIVGAVICYILLITGINYFIIDPRKSWREAMLLGVLIYGVYESTNYAIFRKWSAAAMVLDTCWGGVLFALTTVITQYAMKRL